MWLGTKQRRRREELHVAGIMESKWEEDTPRPGFNCQTKIVGSKFLEVTGRLARGHGIISK